MLVEGIGEEGQAKLKAARALVIGAGGLGSPVLYYLVAAGVGTVGIVDDDKVNISNLQRQILYTTPDIGMLKTFSAGQKLTALNPEVKITLCNCRFTEENAEKITLDYDFIVDCCDNFATKLLINDVCVRMKKPYSHGAVVDMRGEVMTYTPGAACYRCVYDALPQEGQSSASPQTGIIGAVAGITGSIQATEAIKCLIGMRDLLTDRLLVTDAKTMKFISLKVKKLSSCIC